jgi:hypothetical protein
LGDESCLDLGQGAGTDQRLQPGAHEGAGLFVGFLLEHIADRQAGQFLFA